MNAIITTLSGPVAKGVATVAGGILAAKAITKIPQGAGYLYGKVRGVFSKSESAGTEQQ